MARCWPKSRKAGHTQQLLALIQQRQSATDEARQATFVKQALQVTSTATWHFDDFAALAVTNLQRTIRRLTTEYQLTIAG